MPRLHHSAGEPSEAALLCQHVIEADACNHEAHYLLGAARHALDQLDEAIASLTEAFRLKPDFTEALKSLAIVFAQQGKLDDAGACCR